MSIPQKATGQLVVSASLDYDAITEATSVDGKFSLYPASETTDFGLRAMEPVFTRRKPAEGDELVVLSALNGLAKDVQKYYGNSPDLEALFKNAVHKEIQVLGVMQSHHPMSNMASLSSGFVFGVGGSLQVLTSKGSNDPYLRSGQLAQALPPDLNKPLGVVGTRDEKESSPNKFRLKVVPYDPRPQAFRQMAVIRAILDDPDKYRSVMGPASVATHMSITASAHVMQSYLMGGVLLVQQLLANGVLSVANDKVQGLANKVTAAEKGTDVQSQTAVLADLLRVVDYSGARAEAPQDLITTMETVRLKALNSIFYGRGPETALNVYDEFGYVPGQDGAFGALKGRYEDNQQVNRSSAYGSVLQEQLEHFARASAANHSWFVDESRTILGMAVSNELNGVVKIAVGVSRP